MWDKVAIAFVLLVALPMSAMGQESDPKGFNKQGFIVNAEGEKCLYRQTYEETNPHFMPPSLKNTTHHDVRTIRFTDPECMADSLGGVGDAAKEINKAMINNVLTSWFMGSYVLDDARYDIRALRKPGIDQARGDCIVSLTYPTKGIAIEYVSDGAGITGVIYAPTYGCGDKK